MMGSGGTDTDLCLGCKKPLRERKGHGAMAFMRPPQAPAAKSNAPDRAYPELAGNLRPTPAKRWWRPVHRPFASLRKAAMFYFLGRDSGGTRPATR